MNPESWQPIETAPKDGTVILIFGKGVQGSLWLGSKDNPLITIGCWRPMFLDKYLDSGDGAFRKIQEDHSFWHTFGPILYEKTHWMPLPKPPEIKQ